MILCKNVPPLYPEIRNEWESGIVEAYLNGELEEENENSNHSAVNATDNLSSRKVPAYTPVGNDDTWLSYYDAEMCIRDRYMVMRKTTNTNGATRVSGKMINILLNRSCAEVFLAVYGLSLIHI